MNFLVTGGAGYIGSNMSRLLHAKGHTVHVLDTLECGYKESLPAGIHLIVGNLGDSDVLNEIFSKESIDAVIHFAGYISVPESVKYPRKYFENNVSTPVALLESMEQHSIKHIIFSSTAAVYGWPQTIPIPENHLKKPTNPYGLSKWCFEELLKYYDQKGTIRSITLRYFNAAGASFDGNFGESHSPETHIIPLAIATALGKRESFMLYGTDYPTRDGSCERDYIHVEDLGTAHLAALDALRNNHETTVYNVGTGKGVTNREVVEKVKRVTGVNFQVKEEARRQGDAHVLVADPSRLMSELGWKPTHSDIDTIIESAWKWHKNHPEGYK